MRTRSPQGWLRTILVVWALPGVCAIPGQASDQEADKQYFLTPRYQVSSPEHDLLKKVSPQEDSYAAEAYAEQTLSKLTEFGELLEQSPAKAVRIADILASEFRGAHLTGREETLRQDSSLQIRRGTSISNLELDRTGFLQEFQTFVSPYRRILTAEFEMVGVTLTRQDSQPVLETRIHYDLVGIPDSAWRGQQTGEWELEWKQSSDKQWRVIKWTVVKQARNVAHHPLFVDVSEQALGHDPLYARQLKPGIDHWRTVLDGATGINWQGSHGVSLGDIDNDGDDDLYVAQPAGLPNRLLRNDGDGTFSDITDHAGVAVLDSTSMSLFADVDNDGDQDLIVCTSFSPLLFLNDGTGAFKYKPKAFQFSATPRAQFTSAAMADYDRDGDLDIFICAYGYHFGTGTHRVATPYHDANNGPPNFLFRNRGDGTFEDVTESSGVDQNNRRFSFAVSWEDYNRDGWPDLYVANDFGRNNLYRNNGDGTLSEIAAEAGVEDIGAGMSVSWLDYDRDGLPDLYTGNMWSSAGLRITSQPAFPHGVSSRLGGMYKRHAKGNSLFRNRGDGTFEDVSFAAMVERGHWAWSSDSADFDNDGHEDLYIANGLMTNSDAPDL